MARSERTGIWLREDAITALNLQDLWKFRSSGLTVVDFSPYFESTTTGADWEWWFIDAQGSFGAAVQAKSLRNGRYDFGYTPAGSNVTYIPHLSGERHANFVFPQALWLQPFSSLVV
jgi:hypothetical protein